MKQETDMLDHVRHVLRRDSNSVSSDFDLDPQIPASWPPMTNLRPAAVLIPLINTARGLDVILTKRASHLKHHPGQIAFPGGKEDDSDIDATDTALREAVEEIGLARGNVDVLGTMPYHETVTHFRITPVVGHVLTRFEAVPEPGEVDEVFQVPLAYLSDPANFRIEGRFWGGKKRLYYTIPYGPYYIWGATARILRGFAERLSR